MHGIPASHTQGLQKLEREHYFRALADACALPLDVLVTHSNAMLPGLHDGVVRGDDGTVRAAARE